MRYLIALALACTVAATVTPAYAAPAEQTCMPGAFLQSDMAGTYVSVAHQMRITVFPCGGIDVLWSNMYGTHEASYYSIERMPDGGIFSRVAMPDPIVRSLDGRNVIGLKPAEIGFIQVLTIGPFGDDPKVYRLRKI